MPRLRRRGFGLSRHTRNALNLRRRRQNAVSSQQSPINQSNSEYRTLQEDFEQSMKIKYFECTNCAQSVLSVNPILLCKTCIKKPEKLSDQNKMCPGTIPPELQGLTYVEQLLISRVQPIMQVYRIKSKGIPGQYAFHGNIINIGQSIHEIAQRLPRLPSSLSTIIVRREHAGGHRDFHVRKDEVLKALLFLKNNNPFYSDVIIDADIIASLPNNDNIILEMPSVSLEGEQEVEEDNPVYESFIPQNMPVTEQERIQNLLSNVTMWPEATGSISEFSCEGYISMAFPALLPYGNVILYDHSRPNNMKITPVDFFRYLLHYKDGRFAKDPRFRFFALNTIQRHEAIKQGSLFAKKTKFTGTIAELKQVIVTRPDIASSLYYWCGKIRGSNQYWFQRRGELESMVNQLGIPTAFLTFSAADLWWPDLAKLMGVDFEQEATLNEVQIARQRQKLINDNPLIVEEYFAYRSKMFMENVVCKRYPVTDFWYRYEYQHRGSCHLHGVIWIEGAPDPKLFNQATPGEIEHHKLYYEHLVSACNPLIAIPPAPIHPSRLRSTDVILDDEVHVSELLNRLQRHTRCSKGYCLKWNGTAFACRFKYPKQITDHSKLEKDEKGHWTFTPKRNDTLLNQYNSFFAQTWRANTDFQVISSEYAIVNYIAKYASKSEPASKSLTDLFQEVVNTRDANDDSRKAFVSLMMRIIGGRDIGACEACHIVMDIPLYHSSRKYQAIVIKLVEYTSVQDGTDNTTFIEFYCQRPQIMDGLNLFDFAKGYSKGPHGSVSKNRKDTVVQVFPKVKINVTDPDRKELYFKQMLMLYTPWRELVDLKSDDETWQRSYERRQLQIEQINIDMSLATVEEDAMDNEFEQFNDRDWMAIAAAMPNAIPGEVTLGNRDIDLNFNWMDSFTQFCDIKNNINFIDIQKQNAIRVSTSINFDPMSANADQKKVMLFLNEQLQHPELTPKLAIIQGKAGTGKSFLISIMVQNIRAHFQKEATLLLAPTGVAANNINGSTIHSVLRIYAKQKFDSLSNDAKLDFQSELQDIQFVIIDEASMVGLNMFYKIDQRLREAKPHAGHLPFGGLNIFLVGDWSQLPPVCDISLYNPGRNITTVQAGLLYYQFLEVFFLNQIVRQQGQDQRCFRETLNNIASGQISESDYTLLSTRFYTNCPDRLRFEDAVYIMATNKEIEQHNYKMLEAMKMPVALIKSVNNCSEAQSATIDEAQGLQAELRLAKGAKVILRRNLWVDKGLANGSVGLVIDIIYDPESQSNSLPICLLIEFKNYSGPVVYGNCVPIVPVTSSFQKNGVSCSRTQFPVILGFAISIHRSQGITLDKAIVDLGKKEFQIGLTYVALSRVKTLNGLLIKPTFNFDRLLQINKAKATQERNKEIHRLKQLSECI